MIFLVKCMVIAPSNLGHAAAPLVGELRNWGAVLPSPELTILYNLLMHKYIISYYIYMYSSRFHFWYFNRFIAYTSFTCIFNAYSYMRSYAFIEHTDRSYNMAGNIPTCRNTCQKSSIMDSFHGNNCGSCVFIFESFC